VTQGERIKELRKKKNLTQEQLARMLKTTKQTIYKYETNVVTNIPIEKVKRMSEIFGASVQYIMCADNDPKEYSFEWHSRGQRFDPAYLHQKVPRT
jgi:transcriptional regulator with XRE-family HTH domain